MPRHPHTAPRASELSDRVFSALVARAKASGKPTAPLHVGDTYLDPPAVVRDALRDATTRTRGFNYANVQGEPELLAAIHRFLARRYETRPDADDVQVMPGGTAGLSVVASALLEPGDEVLLPAPFWPLVRGIVKLRGATPLEIPFFDRVGTEGFDPERALRAAIGPRTVAIYLNSPNNPTGVVLAPDVLRAVLRVAEEHDLWILADEAYELLAFDEQSGHPPPMLPLWALEPRARERTIAVHTLSKSYGMAGARIAFAHGPSSAMARVRAVQTFTTYCAPRPLQLAAARVLDEGEAWVVAARGRYARAAETAARALRAPTPRAGTFLFVDGRTLAKRDEPTLAFLERCVDQGVLLTPGSACGEHYADWLRLCFTSVPQDELERALAALEPLLAHPAATSSG